MARVAFERFASQFKVDTSDPDIMRAQLDAFTKQVPLLYFILAVNAGAAAFTHYGIAPFFLSVVVPGTLILAVVARIVHWLRSGRQEFNRDQAARRLVMTVRLGGVFAILFLTWAISLMAYGDAYSQSQVVFAIAVTAFSCILCLTHLRAAALTVTAIVIPVFAVILLFSGERSFIAIGFNLILVSAAMVYVLLIQSRDFTQMVRAQGETQRLSDDNYRLANLDALSDLPNRRQFFSRLDACVARAKETGETFCVGTVDLDGFKPVNDLYGHLTGDRLLVETGRRLMALADENTFFARLGGDEFGMIRMCGADEGVAFGETICAALAQSYVLPGVMTRVSGSLGLAVYPDSAQTGEDLYESADYALYKAKQTRGGGPVMFSAELRTNMREFVLIEQRLREADMEREFTLEFQPLYEMDSDRPVAFEALARWSAPGLGVVPPGVFIPIAERSELINKLTQTLLRKALVEAASWPEDIMLSVNLSIHDLMSSEAVLSIISLIRNSNVSPSRIDLEVTESALMSDFQKAHDAILAFKALGVHISLDDFGTGYSSLSYVHKLPFDRIKIDRSFVQEIDTHHAARDIVRTVVNLCRNLDLQCVTEGVETAAQANMLRDLGCTTMQGFYFARPMSPAAVDALMADFSSRPLRAAAG